MEWQPIETAPVDQELLFYLPKWTGSRILHCSLKEDRSLIYDMRPSSDDYPTHWMPLPKPPESPDV